MTEGKTEIDIEAHFKTTRRTETMLEKIDGYKTYIIAVSMLCYAIGGFISGYVQLQQAIEVALLAAGMMGLKHSNQKVEEKLAKIMNPGE